VDQLARSSVQWYNSTDCPYKRNLVKLKTWVGWFYSNNWKLSASSGYSKATSAVMELVDVSMYCSQCFVPSKRKINFLPKGSCCQVYIYGGGLGGDLFFLHVTRFLPHRHRLYLQPFTMTTHEVLTQKASSWFRLFPIHPLQNFQTEIVHRSHIILKPSSATKW